MNCLTWVVSLVVAE
jgi:hypothetical protein